MTIDPQGWLITLPLTVALVWAYFLPADHVIKQFWRHLAETEAQGLATMFGYAPQREPGVFTPAQHVAFWGGVACLGLSSLLSMGAYAGLL